MLLRVQIFSYRHQCFCSGCCFFYSEYKYNRAATTKEDDKLHFHVNRLILVVCHFWS